MNIEDLLKRKRDGKEFNETEIKYFIDNVVNGNITNAQTGAMLMAIFIRGLTRTETIIMTKAMINSGEIMNWKSEWKNLLVDKHSTGGVGDKLSIVLAPALAACGLKVPMISGRFLEFTGGTLDKLESIPGFNVNLSKAQLETCLESAGCFIIETNENFCPGDKILYNKRNETSTVDYINLITCSILSKKAVEEIKYLVLDIKVGQGAFMKDIESARKLARELVQVSDQIGIKARALITKMDHPLGRAVGNSLEITECIHLMKGEYVPDIEELLIDFGGILLEMSEKAESLQQGKEMVKESLKNGKALQHFYKMLINQGVDEKISNDLCYGADNQSPLPSAKYQTEILAEKSGWIEEIDALTIGNICYQLTNTSLPNNETDLTAGVYLKKTIGESIKKDEPWLIVYHSTPEITSNIKNRLEKSVTISKNKNELVIIKNKNLILDFYPRK